MITVSIYDYSKLLSLLGEGKLYAKLFKSLFEGSMRGKSDVILVWVNLLAHADQEGFVDRHFMAIADETGLGLSRVTAAISELEAPDPDSRSPEFEGRRIERMDEHRLWGWRIVNYIKYREIRNTEERRRQNRLAQARFREKKKPKLDSKHDRQQRKQKSAVSAQVEVEVEVKEKKERCSFKKPSLEEIKNYCQERKNTVDPQAFHDFYESNGWKVGRNSMRDWRAAVRTWEKRQPPKQPDIPEEAIQQKIVEIKESESYHRGNYPPPGKTLRQVAWESLTRKLAEKMKA